jgi:hypothetical protein
MKMFALLQIMHPKLVPCSSPEPEAGKTTVSTSHSSTTEHENISMFV